MRISKKSEGACLSDSRLYTIALILSYNLDPIAVAKRIPCVDWLLRKSGRTQSRHPICIRRRKTGSSH